MELFTVTCTTCQSRLKVRERAVIGQILACPKCQGMVLVQPPAGWTDPGEKPIAATAAPATTTVPPPLVKTQPAAAPAPADSHFEDAAQLLAPVSAPATATLPRPEPLPAEMLVSPQQKMRRWIIAGGLGIVGTVGLIAAAAYGLRGGAANPDQAVAVVESQPAAENQPAPESTEQPPPPATETPSPATPPLMEEAAEPKPLVDELPVEPAKEPPPVAEIPVEPKPPASSDLPPDLAPKNEDPPAEESAPKPLNTFSAEKSLQELSPLIEDKPFDPPVATPGDTPLPMAEPAPAKLAGPEALDEEPLPRPEPRRIDIARRLADPLDAVELTDVPLAEFLQLVTDLSTIPITLELGTLPAVKASPESKVGVRLQKATISELLTAALKPLQMTYVERNGGLVVMPIASSQGQLRQIKHDVSDLAKDETELAALAELTQAVIDPLSWKANGGAAELETVGPSLVVTQSPEAHFSLIVLCEKLRLARKLPTRTQYAPEILTLTPRFAAAQPLLDTPVTLNFVPPTRLNKVSDRVRALTGLRMLVDWQAVADQEWTPEAEVKIGAANVPLSQFLDRLTKRMDLAYRVIDPQTVQLTTSDALKHQPDVEVYPLAGNDREIIAKLQAALGSDWFSPELGHALRYDAASQSIVARVPQPGQRRLAEALNKGT